MPRTDETLLGRAKAMRADLPEPERRLWLALRAKRFATTKFSRQVVIGPFIADFVARSRKLVIEVDGDTHVDPARDARRTAWLKAQGYRVIRFTNTEVMRNLEGVLLAIQSALTPSPLRGEGWGEGQPQAAPPGTAPLPTLSPKGRGL